MAKTQSKRTAKAQEGNGARLGFWIVGGLLFAGAVTGGIVLYNKRKKKKKADSGSADFPESKPSNSSKPKTSTPKPQISRGDSFPLSRGSKGQRVRKIQNALIAKFGAGVLPRYGADGDWGGETQKALQNAGWPTRFTALNFDQYARMAPAQGIPSNTSSIQNFHDEAWNLHRAAKQRDFATANGILSRMSSTSDYLKIRKSFITWPFIGTANYTPVNALLLAFPNQRSTVEGHFRRMGLVKRGDKWALSGLGILPAIGRMIRTKRNAPIWTEDDMSITIPTGLVLGREVRSSGGFTLFRNGNDETYFVHTKDVEFA